MNAAIYVRVSTLEQAKSGYSVPAQKQRLQAFCESQGWDIAGLYADEGVSAKDTNRPELQRMLNDIESGHIDVVVVYKLDRLTRSVMDLYKLLEAFEQHDCKFRSITEVYDTTTAMGRMFITLVASFAQFERENLGERVQLGMLEKARQGKWTSVHEPFGYRLDKKEYKLYIVEEEAIIVRKIFNLYRTTGMKSIAGILNRNNMLTRKGNRWSDNTIMKTLRNPVYCGYLEWSGETHKAYHEPIISEEQFEETQQITKERTTAPPRSISSNYIFSQTLRCHSCGKSLVGNPTTYKHKGKSIRYFNYRCREKIRDNCKGCRNVSEIKLESAFVDYLSRIDYSDIYDEVVNEKPNDDNKAMVMSLESTLDKIESRKKKWQYAWSEDVITFDDFKKRMDEEKEKEARIKSELENYASEEPEERIDKKVIIEALKDIRKNWENLERHEKKQLVMSTIKQIHYEHIGYDIKINRVDFK